MCVSRDKRSTTHDVTAKFVSRACVSVCCVLCVCVCVCSGLEQQGRRVDVPPKGFESRVAGSRNRRPSKGFLSSIAVTDALISLYNVHSITV